MDESRRNEITVEVTIDLNRALMPRYDFDGNPVGVPTLEEAVLDAVAEKLAQRTLDDTARNLRHRAEQALNEKIDAQAEGMIDGALEAVVTRTDQFGQPKGTEQRTFREYMVDRITGWLTQPAPGDSFSRKRSNAQAVIEGALNRKFSSEMTKAIEAGKQEALKAVREQSAELMAKVLGDVATRCESCGGTQGRHYRNCPIHPH